MSRAGDPVRLEVFQHLFAAAAEEMGVTLMRSAFSPNIKERRDFSCALFDHSGRMIGQAAHLPVHLGSAPLSVQAAIEAVDMQPGDSVLLNDPYAGGTHLPDLTLVSPVFLDGRSKPDFYCANRAHHADVGGAQPGSMAPAFDVHGEGVRVPPVRLHREGELDRDVFKLLLANMRVTDEREGDLLAQGSANRVGVQRIEAMAREYGRAALCARARELMDWTERLTRALLRSLPDGTIEFEDELEGAGDPPARIRLRWKLKSDRLEVDFRETDDQRPGALNTTRAVVVSAVFYALRLLLPPGTPTNDGILRPVTLITRPGSLVDACYPAGVAAGNVETSQRLVDVLLGVLAQILPERVPAASAGTMSNLTFGGTDATGGAFTYYETIAGGAGAGPRHSGAHAVQTHMTNTRNTPIEAFERRFPARVIRATIARGSGGLGRRPGGDGVIKRLRFLRPVQVAWMAERQAKGPWGLAGGGDGQPGGARSWPLSGDSREASGSSKWNLDAGDEFEVQTPGGGGHGSIDQ